MKTFFKNKVVTVLILLATLVLAGVAIFTAYRLYQLRQQAVAPTAPESKPEAAAPQACTALTFTITLESPSPSPSPEESPSPSPGVSPSPSPSPEVSPSPTATPTSSPIAQASPTAEPSLPEAGTSWPTIVGLGVGILLLLGSLLLAL